MRQLIRDRAICGEFNAWRWSLVLRLAIVVGCMLLPMKPGYGTEPAKRTQLGRWFRISKIPSKPSERALRKPLTHRHPDRMSPTQPVGDGPPAGKMAASSFRSRRANSEYVGSVRPVAAQSLDGETAATISPESNDAPLTLDVPPTPEDDLTAEIPAAMSMEMLTALADAHHPRLTAAFQRVQANIARLEIERISYLLQRARVEPIPNIDVMGGYQRQVGIPAQDQGLFQVTISIPLWNKNQGNVAAAQAELSGAHADLSRVELDLANSAAEAVATLRTAEQIVERYEIEILPKARETLKLSQDLYAQGEIDFLRLLQSQKTLLEAELSRIAAQEQRWVSAAALAGLLQDEVFP